MLCFDSFSLNYSSNISIFDIAIPPSPMYFHLKRCWVCCLKSLRLGRIGNFQVVIGHVLEAIQTVCHVSKPNAISKHSVIHLQYQCWCELTTWKEKMHDSHHNIWFSLYAIDSPYIFPAQQNWCQSLCFRQYLSVII